MFYKLFIVAGNRLWWWSRKSVGGQSMMVSLCPYMLSYLQKVCGVTERIRTGGNDVGNICSSFRSSWNSSEGVDKSGLTFTACCHCKKSEWIIVLAETSQLHCTAWWDLQKRRPPDRTVWIEKLCKPHSHSKSSLNSVSLFSHLSVLLCLVACFCSGSSDLK